MYKKKTYILIIFSLSLKGGGGLKALSDISAKNVSFFYGSPCCTETILRV